MAQSNEFSQNANFRHSHHQVRQCLFRFVFFAFARSSLELRSVTPFKMHQPLLIVVSLHPPRAHSQTGLPETRKIAIPGPCLSVCHQIAPQAVSVFDKKSPKNHHVLSCMRGNSAVPLQGVARGSHDMSVFCFCFCKAPGGRAIFCFL